jgi:protein-tyrosine phosphatase
MQHMVKGTGQEVRTSATHPIQVNWLPADAADGVGLTFAPGKKGSSIYGYRWDRDLAADLQTLAREHRVQTLVTLMEDHELASSRIPGLIASTEHHGIASVHFPIPDLGVPDDASDVNVLLDGIEARLASGERVVIHCLGGIGRTGTIATCLLVRRGMTVADATRVVQDTRCKGFPESAAQKRFVAVYGRRVEKLRPSALLDRRGSATAQTTGRSSAPTPGAATLRDSSARGDKGLPWSVLGTSERARQHGGVALSRDQVCELLGAIEQQVSAAPAECFSLDLDGTATLHVKSRSYHAGQFEVPTLATLEQRVLATPPATRGRIRMSILRGTDGIRWRDEWTGVEGSILERAVEPRAQLPGHAQLMERLAVIASSIVNGGVARLAKAMEQVGHLAGQQAIVPQAREQVDLVLAYGGVDTGVGCRPLGENFAELPQLDQARARVADEVPLRERTEVIEETIVRHQEPEVCRRWTRD